MKCFMTNLEGLVKSFYNELDSGVKFDEPISNRYANNIMCSEPITFNTAKSIVLDWYNDRNYLEPIIDKSVNERKSKRKPRAKKSDLESSEG